MKRFTKFDTNISVNPKCEKCPNAETRNLDDDGLCKNIVSVTDGLPVRCVGEWANEKIYYLLQYFQIFTQGMLKKWDELKYVEICSGPGRCSTRDGNEQDGTALAIIKNPLFDSLSEALFVDNSSNVVKILSERIEALGKSSRAHAIVGDYNNAETILAALKGFSKKTLTLCFVDPTDCSVPFDTIRSIFEATNRNCDFIISFFDGSDFHRNAVGATLDETFLKSREKYSRFLGSPDFFSEEKVVFAAKRNDCSELSKLFREQYSCNLGEIGLCYNDWKNINKYYYLLYATSNSRGLDFWKKSSRYDSAGQGELDLGV